MCMLGLKRCFLRSTVRSHPDFPTAICPVRSIDATRFVFRLCLLPPLVNNHIRLLFMRSALYYTVMLVCLIYGHVLYGAPAFIQHVVIYKLRSLVVDMCRTLVAEEPHRSTILNLEHFPLKANVRCLVFPLQQGKMSSVQPLSGLDSPTQGSREKLTNAPSYHSPPSLSPFTIGKATRALPALAAFSLYLP
jgi:hypothetical protein